MKKVFFPLVVLFAFTAISFLSCDKIEPPFQVETNTIVVDSTDSLCAFPAISGGSYRKVLVEEYTGHLCGNCPPAGIYLNDTLKPKYEDSIVVISVHAGYFAATCPGGAACPSGAPNGSFSANFSTAIGEQWYSDFSFTTNPLAMINRVGYPASHKKAKSQWDNTIKSQLLTLSTARIRINNTYDESSRKLNTCIETKFLAYMNDTIRMQVVLTEDSIINWQVYYGNVPEDVPDYTHRHVLRSDVGNDSLANGNISPDKIVLKGYTFDIPSNWNADHVTLVAFAYKTSTREIIQVEERKIK
jgi:hypothetical protein